MSDLGSLRLTVARVFHDAVNGSPEMRTAATRRTGTPELQAQQMPVHTVAGPRTGETVAAAPAAEHVSDGPSSR